MMLTRLSHILARPDASTVLCADGSLNLAHHRAKGPLTLQLRGRDGTIHTVSTDAVLGGVVQGGAIPDIIVNAPNPSDYGGTVDYSSLVFIPDVPSDADMKQGQVSDCFADSILAQIASRAPDELRSIMVKVGDRYETRFVRNGQVTRVRTDGTGNDWYTPLGPTRVFYPVAFQKCYAFYRTGANTIASLNVGWSGDVARDLGYTAVMVQPYEAGAGTTLLAADAANHKIQILTTSQQSPYFPDFHEMGVDKVEAVDGDPTDVWVSIWNQWQVDGSTLNDGANDGKLRYKLSQIAPYLQCFTIVSNFSGPILPNTGNPPPVVTPAPTPAPMPPVVIVQPTPAPTSPSAPSQPVTPTPAPPATTPPTPSPSPATPSAPITPSTPTPEPAMPATPLALPASVLAKAAQISGGVYTPYQNAIIFAGVGNITYTLPNTFVAGWYVLSVTCWSAHSGSVPRVRVYVADSMHEVYPQPSPSTAAIRLIAYFYNLRAGQSIRVEGVDAGLRVSSIDLKPIDLGGVSLTTTAGKVLAIGGPIQ